LVPRVDCAVGNPAGEIVDDPLVEFAAILGHVQPVQFVADGKQQAAFVWLARHDDFAVVPTGQQAIAIVQSQTPFGDISGIVAVITMFDENRPDPHFEKLNLLRVRSPVVQGHGC
jgi:hypothetical protein